MQTIVELSVGLKTIGTASYTVEKAGVAFKRFLAFQTTTKVATDRLLVSEEAVRMLDTRE